MDTDRRSSGPLGRALDVLESRANNITLASMGFVLVVGSALAINEGTELPYHDERQYLDLADFLVEEHRYTLDGVNPTAYKPPVWPAFLAVLRWLGVGVVGLRLANVALLALCVLLGALVARRISGKAAGSIAAVLIAIFPISLYTSTTLYPQILATALMLGGVLAATAIPDSSRPKRAAVGAGICFGVLLLTVPQLALVFGFLLAWLWVTLRTRALPMIAIALVVAAVLPVSWMVRNAVQMDAFIPIATVDAVQLMSGNNENARPDLGPTADVSRYEAETIRQNMTEVERTHYLRESAITWMRENPRDAAELYAGKLVHHFGFRDRLHTAEESSALRDFIAAASYYPLLVLVGIRIALSRRYRPTRLEVVIVSWYVFNAFVTAVFFPRIRYRVAADLLLIAEAAVGALVLLKWLRDRRDDAPAGEDPLVPSGVETASSNADA